jgi:tetratricopeptide (TPR) repeat protein
MARASLLFSREKASKGMTDAAKEHLTGARTLIGLTLKAMPSSGASLFMLGNVESELGNADSAMEAWKAATRNWPDFAPAYRAIAGVDRTLQDRLAAIDRWENEQRASRLARCGHIYLHLNLPERAERCFRAADALEPAYGMATRLDHLAESDRHERDKQAIEALLKTRHPEILARAAIASLEQGKPDIAFELLREGDIINAGSRSLNRAWIQSCASVSSPVCVDIQSRRIRTRKFDHIEHYPYRGAQRSTQFEDYAAPRIQEFRIVPVLKTPAPEMEDLVVGLAKTFRGIKFTIVPPEALNLNLQVGRWIPLTETVQQLPREPGSIVIFDAPFPSIVRYSQLFFPLGASVISVNRLRSEEGAPTNATATAERQTAAKRKFRSIVTNQVARLIGMNSPCSADVCALRDITGLDTRGESFCELHQQELQRIVPER